MWYMVSLIHAKIWSQGKYDGTYTEIAYFLPWKNYHVFIGVNFGTPLSMPALF